MILHLTKKYIKESHEMALVIYIMFVAVVTGYQILTTDHDVSRLLFSTEYSNLNVNYYVAYKYFVLYPLVLYLGIPLLVIFGFTYMISRKSFYLHRSFKKSC